jgi:hypothetical protein
MITATKCQCGAVTVAGDDFDNSMAFDVFTKEYPCLELEENIFCNCNHCVNHWGVDLCNCGSGEPVGECDGGLYDCINNIPAQVKGELKETMMWRQ